MELGIIGLGKIGGNLALQCVEKGIHVVGKARRPKPQLAEMHACAIFCPKKHLSKKISR